MGVETHADLVYSCRTHVCCKIVVSAINIFVYLLGYILKDVSKHDVSTTTHTKDDSQENEFGTDPNADPAFYG